MFTYSDNPATSSRDAVRFLIQDTVDSTHAIEDAEIDWLLTEQANVYLAAALAAEAIAAKYTSKADEKSVGDLRIVHRQTADRYRALAATLRRRASVGSAAAAPWFGGLSISEKRAEADNTDRVQPAFIRNDHDSPGTRGSTTDEE